jgi:hypothetical protein
VSGTLSTYDLLASRFQYPSTRLPEIGDKDAYQAIRSLLTNHNTIMRNLLSDLGDFADRRERRPSFMRPDDADALRMLSDQLEERGDDPGAALLRDVADRLEAMTEPRLIDWPRYLGVGEMRVFGVEVNTRILRDHGQYQWLIDAEPVGKWVVNEVDQPDRRVSYRR